MKDYRQKAVTETLDQAIASIAKCWFEEFSQCLSKEEVAGCVFDALRSLEGLAKGKMPNYNEWDALFYALWYQPSQINLAYTIAIRIPVANNPLMNGIGALNVLDFGCGSFAMKYGLVIARSEFSQHTSTRMPLFVAGTDPSDAMRGLGDSIWNAFSNEIQLKKYDNRLKSLRHTIDTMSDVRDDFPSNQWLTALHVAYKQNFELVKKELDRKVSIEKPALVIVTTHPYKGDVLYSPHRSKYDEIKELPRLIGESDMKIQGVFEKTTAFRRDLWRKLKSQFQEVLSREDCSFVYNYLNKYDTTWTITGFEADCRVYSRKALPF